MVTKSKTCQGCGITFKPNYGAQRFCSVRCWTTSAEIRELLRELWQKPEHRVLMLEVLKANNSKKSARKGSSK